jgi:hypothetical protein
MTSHEKFFECILVVDRNEYCFHIRAWDAAEAEHHLCASLRENGVHQPGAILIRDARGAVLRSASYDGDGSPAPEAHPRGVHSL